jgi:hypothetical protein
MTSRASFVHPPRLAVWLVHLFAAGVEAESLLGDMLEEFSHLASKSGPAFARRWFWRQTRNTIANLFTNAFRVAPWQTAATVIGGFLLNRLVSRLPEPAIFAVLHRYQVFDHHFNVYVFFASDGIALGHVLAAMFVGCAMAWAAKDREMVVTITLGFVFCVMEGAAVCVSLAARHTMILGMLPWFFADCFAMVLGGIMVRTHRSGATTLPSAS